MDTHPAAIKNAYGGAHKRARMDQGNPTPGGPGENPRTGVYRANPGGRGRVQPGTRNSLGLPWAGSALRFDFGADCRPGHTQHIGIAYLTR